MTEAILNIGVRSSGVVEAGKALDGLSDASDRAEKSTKGLEFSMGLLKGALGALSIGAVVAGFKSTADAWSDMQSRVGAAVKNMDAAPRLMQRMVDIANASYSPLSQTVEVYSRNVSVLGALGKTANEAADFTEALNHALVITATKGQQAESVQNALAKAMAVGKLQADGLETVLANGGRVAELLAAQLGTTVNGLRQMATDGKITGDVIATSLIGNLETLREQAAEMPATIGDAFVRIQTNLLATIGSFDQTVGASGALAEVLILIADNMDRVITTAGTAAVAFGTYYVGGLAAAALATGGLTGALALLRLAIAGTGIGILVLAAGELMYQFLELVKAVGGFGNAFRLMGDVVAEVWDRMIMGANAAGLRLTAVWEGIKSGFFSMVAAMAERWADFLHNLAAGLADIPLMGEAFTAVQSAAVGAGSDVYKFQDLARGALESAEALQIDAAAISEQARAPLESVAALSAALQKAAEDQDALFTGGSGGGADSGGGGKGKDEKSRAADRIAREMEQRLEVLRTGLMTEEEERLAAYARDLETLDWHLANKKITEDEYNAMRLQAERDLQNDLQQIRLMGYASALSSVGDMMGSMAAIMGGNNEKMLKAQRIFAAASALIDTYAGAAKALTLPFPANLAAAAAILAKGMALVAAIRSGSKSASSGGGGGGGGGSTAQAVPQAKPQKTQAVEINLHGEVFTKQSVADLMNKMNENLADGFQLHIRTT